MSELESETDVLETEATAEEVAEPEQAAELASDSQGQDEQTAKPEVNQEKINEVINKKHREAREAEERANALEEQLQQLKAQTNVSPVVPQKPDQFSDNYDAEMATYEKALVDKAMFDANQQASQQASQHAQQESMRAQQQEIETVVNTYNKRGEDFGINKQDLDAAGDVIVSYGINRDAQLSIAEDENGPLITKYLAANPVEAATLASMIPRQAAAYIAKTLSVKAAALKPKPSNAPKPADRVDGGGADPELGRYPLISGATIE